MATSTQSHENVPFIIPRPYSAANDPALLAARQQAIRLKEIRHPEFSSQKTDIDVHEEGPASTSTKHSQIGLKKRKRSREEDKVDRKTQKEFQNVHAKSEDGTTKMSDGQRVKKEKHKHDTEGRLCSARRAEAHSTMTNQNQKKPQDPKELLNSTMQLKDKKNSHRWADSSKARLPKPAASVVRDLRPSLEAIRSTDPNNNTASRSILSKSSSSSSESTSSSTSSPSPSLSPSSSSSEADTLTKPGTTSYFPSISSTQKRAEASRINSEAHSNIEIAEPKTQSTTSTAADEYWRAVSDLKRIIPSHLLEAAASQLRKSNRGEVESSTQALEDLTAIFTAARNLIFLLSAKNLTGNSMTPSRGGHDKRIGASSTASFHARGGVNVSLMEQQLTRIASEQSKRLDDLELKYTRSTAGKK